MKMKSPSQLLLAALAFVAVLSYAERAVTEVCERKLPDGTEVEISSPTCDADRERAEENKKNAAMEAEQEKLRAEQLAKKIKELASDKSLISVAPGTQLCNFPMTGRGFIFTSSTMKCNTLAWETPAHGGAEHGQRVPSSVGRGA
jgi:hypothetical protein